jgi:hypothetical protein
MKRRVERLGLDETVVQHLRLAGIETARQLFETSPLQIMAACDMDLQRMHS